MLTRRIFIKQSALFSAAALTTPADLISTYRQIGLQLYTLRAEIVKDPTSVIQNVAAIGYKEVESFGYHEGKYFGMSPKAFASLLKSNGLTHPSGHYMLANLSKDWQKAIDDAAEAGQQYMVVAYLLDTERESLDDYKKIAAQFNKAAELCKTAGIQFGYHNHDFEFKEMGGGHGFDILLKETDPSLVKFELDLYWVSYSGRDPIELFKQHPGRFPLWHVKDMDNTPKNFFTEVGSGIIDFKKIFSQAQLSGMKHFFVEQDVCPGPPIDSVKKSYQYIRKNLVN